MCKSLPSAGGKRENPVAGERGGQGRARETVRASAPLARLLGDVTVGVGMHLHKYITRVHTMLVLCCQFYPCSEAILSYARAPCPVTGLPPSMRLHPSRAPTRMFVPTVHTRPTHAHPTSARSPARDRASTPPRLYARPTPSP